MQKKLLEAAFEKARGEGASNTALGLATHIYNELETKCAQPTTADSIRGYYRKLEKNEPFNISKTGKDHLAIYLGHENYKKYLDGKNTKNINAKRYQFVLLVMILVVAFLVYDANRKKCMIWENDRYVKIHCEEENAKPISPGLLANFRKLEPDCKQEFFFNPDASPKVWYYKRGDKDLEFFSTSGSHPINGRDLKKINEDMIRKHTCFTFNE